MLQWRKDVWLKGKMILQKILIHDMKNHLHTIFGLSERGGETEIQEYIQQLLELPVLKSSVTYCSQPVFGDDGQLVS